MAYLGVLPLIIRAAKKVCVLGLLYLWVLLSLRLENIKDTADLREPGLSSLSEANIAPTPGWLTF